MSTSPALCEQLHGYTITELDGLARAATRRHHGRADSSDIYHAAWTAITDTVLTSTTKPSIHELRIAALNGICDLIRTDHRHAGRKGQNGYNDTGSAPRFARYWNPTLNRFDDELCDLIALGQVLALLTAKQLDALIAIAQHPTEQAAARAYLVTA